MVRQQKDPAAKASAHPMRSSASPTPAAINLEAVASLDRRADWLERWAALDREAFELQIAEMRAVANSHHRSSALRSALEEAARQLEELWLLRRRQVC